MAVTQHKLEISKFIGSDFIVLSKVEKWNSMVKVKCTVHSKTFEARADWLKVRCSGCSECRSEAAKIRHENRIQTKEYTAYVEGARGRATKSISQHRQELKVVNPSIRILEILPKHRAAFACRVCKTEWSFRLDTAKSGAGGCPTCGRIAMSVKKRKLDEDKLTLNPEYRKLWGNAYVLTSKVYSKFKALIDTEGNTRGMAHHLDHIYSLRDFYVNPNNLKNPITMLELCHPANLQLLPALTNLKKNKTSWISATELRRRIRIWNKVNGNPWKTVRGYAHLV